MPVDAPTVRNEDMLSSMTSTQDIELISPDDIAKKIPSWPFSAHATRRLIRTAKLPAVRIGAKVFVTREIIARFIDDNTKLEVGRTKRRRTVRPS